MVKATRSHKAWLLIGGNMGQRAQNLGRATELIEKYCGHIIRTSSIYETEAWGKTDQPSFLNQALEIETALEPQQLLTQILAIEKKMGRFRAEKYGPRLIDIDILFFDELVMTSAVLALPHPRMQERRFVLAPLAQIASGKVHPVLKKTVGQLLEDCSDPLHVSLYDD